MTINPETVPSTWTTADDTFFGIASSLFSPTFLAGAGVLLASYDDEQIATTITTAVPAPVAATIDTPVWTA